MNVERPPAGLEAPMRFGMPMQGCSDLKLTPSEALYGFAGWLTTRAERTVMSARDLAGPIAGLVEAFCHENDIDPPRQRWSVLLKHPPESAIVKQAEPSAFVGEACTEARATQPVDPVQVLRAQLLEAATQLTRSRDPNAFAFIDAHLRLGASGRPG